MEGLGWRLFGSGLMSMMAHHPSRHTQRTGHSQLQGKLGNIACSWVHRRKENGIARRKGFSYFTKSLERLEV